MRQKTLALAALFLSTLCGNRAPAQSAPQNVYRCRIGSEVTSYTSTVWVRLVQAALLSFLVFRSFG